MTTFAQVVKAAVPGASDDFIEHIIWGRTPYPCGAITAKSLYKAASQYNRAYQHHIRLCDWCHRPAELNDYMCKHCNDALRQCTQEPKDEIPS
jgi:hypothetical protein